MKIEIKPDGTKFCRFLRAKNPYGRLEGGDNPWLLFNDSNTICWCIRSSGSIGPDNGLVAPDRCVQGRRCYEAPGERVGE